MAESAWREAEKNNDKIEVVTDTSEVMELNNIYFSSAWTKAGESQNLNNEEIEMFSGADDLPW